MTKTSLALAALVAAVTLGIHVLPTATAQPTGPVVTGGAHPWVDFSGSTTGSSTDVIYTVPADRVLVVTTFASDERLGWSLLENGTNKFTSNTYNTHFTALTAGNGHMTFQPGSNVQFSNSFSSTYYWYLEGYLAHP
jgi:hypothetical protein